MSFFMIARKMIGGMIDGKVNLKLGKGFQTDDLTYGVCLDFSRRFCFPGKEYW